MGPPSPFIAIGSTLSFAVSSSIAGGSSGGATYEAPETNAQVRMNLAKNSIMQLKGLGTVFTGHFLVPPRQLAVLIAWGWCGSHLC